MERIARDQCGIGSSIDIRGTPLCDCGWIRGTVSRRARERFDICERRDDVEIGESREVLSEAVVSHAARKSFKGEVRYLSRTSKRKPRQCRSRPAGQISGHVEVCSWCILTKI